MLHLRAVAFQSVVTFLKDHPNVCSSETPLHAVAAREVLLASSSLNTSMHGAIATIRHTEAIPLIIFMRVWDSVDSRVADLGIYRPFWLQDCVDACWKVSCPGMQPLVRSPHGWASLEPVSNAASECCNWRCS